ncbi:hypothetical protein [Photobacterium leiognathi]|uniref:hypothetical protein n=1 Tax=Photobacterium leiognathi TaxID=553611 RepID=UPI00273852C7|nr:hypothetical protein [Photobacterium leiognathi]
MECLLPQSLVASGINVTPCAAESTILWYLYEFDGMELVFRVEVEKGRNHHRVTAKN